ncbi:MAG: hypothetical protein COA45_00705 [Zetaproteobacteria bacterium]|nr:MAG: hypothetical protein COA45_00705 [Zetaproteobacteria bacterium]
MIQVIGVKRLIILVILMSANAALAAGVYLYAMPEKETASRRLRSIRSQVNRVQTDIDRMQIEFEQLDQQQDRFDALKAKGLFSTQERSEAKEFLSVIQDKSKVISAVVSVKSGIIQNDEEAQRANHKILMSPIEITIDAFDDASVYRYIELAKQSFPGHLSLDGIKINRTRDISSPVLRAIASGTNPVLIHAEILMSWRTIIPESQVIMRKPK